MTDSTDPAAVGEALSMERAISVNLLRMTSALLVKVAKNSKRPAKGWDPRNNSPLVAQQLLPQIEFTDDNFGIHLTGNLVDVDVDTDNPAVYYAIEEFLPPCQHTWGRESKPKSHRLYQLEEDFEPARYPFLKKLQTIELANIEVRGGAVSRGEYTLLPGSRHPSGEAYEWTSIASARATPTITSAETLLRGIRKVAAVAVIAPHFTDGVRQKMTMALGGFMQRLNSLAEETGSAGFVIELDEALDILRVILDVIEDDRGDRKDRIKAFQMSWEKGEQGTPVTGATTMAEISDDPTLVRTLYSLLTDNPDLQKLESYLERYAIWVGPGTVIDMEKAAQGEPKPIMTRQGFMNSYGHEFVVMNDKRKQIADALFYMANTVRVDGLAFNPEKGLLIHQGDSKYVNQWSGFEVPPHPSDVDESEVQPFIDYMWEVICSKRKDVYAWVMSWLADIFQRPGRKPGTALVLVGTQGAGKSFLGESVIRAIIGDRHSVMTNDMEKVIAKHNALMANKLFIQCDEATNSRQRAATAKVKSLITDRRQIVEPKNVDSYEVDSFSRYMLTSNDIYDAVHLPDGLSDRRFTVVKVSDDKIGEINSYWTKLGDWMKADGNLAKVHRYLLGIKVDEQVVRKCMVTPEKVAMVTSSWDPFDGWLTACVSEHCMVPINLHTTPNVTRMDLDADAGSADRSEWATYCSLQHMYRGYGQFSRGYRHADDLPMDLLHKRLADKGLAERKIQTVVLDEYDDKTGMKTRVRYKYVQLKPREEFEAYLKAKLGWTASDENVHDTNAEPKVNF